MKNQNSHQHNGVVLEMPLGQQQKDGALDHPFQATNHQPFGQFGPVEQSRIEMPEVIQELLSQLSEYARQRALTSGAIEPQEDELKRLEEQAEGRVQECYRGRFAPEIHQHDNLRKLESEQDLKERADAGLARKHAQADVSEGEENLARLAHTRTAPKWPLVIAVAAIILLALLSGATLHDFFAPAFNDEALTWSLALLGGFCGGVFITVGFVRTSGQDGQNTPGNRLMLVSGIVLAGSLGVLRIAQDLSQSTVLTALALTGVEIACLLYLKGLASQLRQAFQDWHERQSQLAATRASLESAQARLARWNAEAARLDRRITDHIRYVEERAQREINLDEIKAAAIYIVRDGYSAGIAENRGRILGIGGTSRRAQR